MARRSTGKKPATKKLLSAGKLIGSIRSGGRVLVKGSARERTAMSSRAGGKSISPKSATLPTGDWIGVAAIRQKLGVSQEELARVTGYSTRSIAGWESGQPLSDSARQKLTETDRLRAALSQIMPPDTLGDWLRTPNPAFEGQTPLQVIERGEADRLWRMIFQIDAGVAS